MFSIKAPETFSAKVTIRDAGGEEHAVDFTFRHMSVSAANEFLTGEHKGRSDLDAISQIVVGWSGVAEDFSREALGELLDNYGGSAFTIGRTWYEALANAREKN